MARAPIPNGGRLGPSQLDGFLISVTHLRKCFALLILLVLAASCGSSDPPTRVLFVGNSFTSYNDLPGMVRDLAKAADQRLEVGVVAPGGWWWRDHAGSAETKNLIAEGDWDFVVLQEQSMAPAAPDLVVRVSYPAALDLATAATGSGARVILFMTWGHAGGSAELGYRNYSSMQVALAEGYEAIADGLGVNLAPVGAAWWMSLSERPDIVLYDPDGFHPNVAGSYLGAAVIAGTLLDVDANSFDEPLGLDGETATALRGFAARAAAGEVPWER